VILLRFGGDLPISEIALALGRTDGAIKSLIHRGLVNLKRRLLEESEQSGTIEYLRRTTVHQTESALLQNRHGTHIEL
jgi:hypothetical protein